MKKNSNNKIKIRTWGNDIYCITSITLRSIATLLWVLKYLLKPKMFIFVPKINHEHKYH